MQLVHRDMYDLKVFNLDGELVANLDSLKGFKVVYVEEQEAYFVIAKDALLNTDLLKFVGREEIKTSLEKELNSKTKITISKNNKFQCKLTAKTYLDLCDDEERKEMTLVFPNASVCFFPSFEAKPLQPSTFDAVFKVIRDDKDDFFDIYI